MSLYTKHQNKLKSIYDHSNASKRYMKNPEEFSSGFLFFYVPSAKHLKRLTDGITVDDLDNKTVLI